MTPEQSAATEPAPAAKRKTRTKDGSITIFDGEMVNRQALADLLHVTPLRISQWVHMPDGLPHTRLPSGDPGRRGLRLMFNVAEVRKWLEKFHQRPNPTRKPGKRR